MDCNSDTDCTLKWGKEPKAWLLLKILAGTSLVVQWLRLCALNSGDSDSVPGQGTRFHTPQLKTPHATTMTEDLYATNKTQSNQINN